MGTVFYECGCSISGSMFEDNRVMQIRVCLRHTLEESIHRAVIVLAGVAKGNLELPENWQDEEVQAALVALAGAVRTAQNGI